MDAQQPVEERWYRYDLKTFLNDEVVMLWAFRVIKHTAKGTWIDYHGKPKFCLTDAKKKFAYPTIEEAEVSFIRRKKRQISLLKAQLENAENMLQMMLHGQKSTAPYYA